MARRLLVSACLLLAACSSGGDGHGVEARIARLQRACDAAARLDDGLAAAPGGPAEAADALKAVARLDEAEGEWGRFRAWAAARPGADSRALAGLDRAWAEYGAARDALREHLRKWSAADPNADQPGLDAKRALDYVTLHNRLSAACGALADWAARVSPADLGR